MPGGRGAGQSASSQLAGAVSREGCPRWKPAPGNRRAERREPTRPGQTHRHRDNRTKMEDFTPPASAPRDSDQLPPRTTPPSAQLGPQIPSPGGTAAASWTPTGAAPCSQRRSGPLGKARDKWPGCCSSRTCCCRKYHGPVERTVLPVASYSVRGGQAWDTDIWPRLPHRHPHTEAACADSMVLSPALPGQAAALDQAQRRPGLGLQLLWDRIHLLITSINHLTPQGPVQTPRASRPTNPDTKQGWHRRELRAPSPTSHLL